MSDIKFGMLNIPCSRCGKKPDECTCSPEEVKDIEGSEHMEHEWGDDRFRGWYLTKTEMNCEPQELGFEDVKHPLRVSDYNYRFIMPSIIDFVDGIITYTPAERLLGVFRFPRDVDGKYLSPVTLDRDTIEGLLNMSEDQLKDLLKNREVLTFEACRTPQFGFEFLDLTSVDFARIELATCAKFRKSFQDQFDVELKRRIEEVKTKIRSTPNNLFILLSVLNRRGPDLKEVTLMTDGLIHV